MEKLKSELRLIVESNSHDNTLIVISNSPGVIEELQHSIDAFCREKQNGIAISKGYKQYIMNANAFLAIQHILYDVLQ